MQARLPSIILLLFLAFASISCTRSSEDDPEPLKEIVGRWDVQTFTSTTYDENGAVEYTSTVPGKPGDYYVFKSDKSFDYHSEDLGAVVAGTYLYTNVTMSMIYQQGTFNGDHLISLFTSTQLVLNSGQKQAGKRSNVQVLSLTKH